MILKDSIKTDHQAPQSTRPQRNQPPISNSHSSLTAPTPTLAQTHQPADMQFSTIIIAFAGLIAASPIAVEETNALVERQSGAPGASNVVQDTKLAGQDLVRMNNTCNSEAVGTAYTGDQVSSFISINQQILYDSKSWTLHSSFSETRANPSFSLKSTTVLSPPTLPRLTTRPIRAALPPSRRLCFRLLRQC